MVMSMAKIEKIIKISANNISISISRREVTICVDDKCSKLANRQALNLFKKAGKLVMRASIGGGLEEESTVDDIAAELEEVERGKKEMEEVI